MPTVESLLLETAAVTALLALVVFFPGFLLNRVLLLMFRAEHSQAKLHLFEVLPSPFKEQKKLLLKALRPLKEYKVVVLGDREFCAVKLARWLSHQSVYFCLRLRCHEYLQQLNGDWQQLKQLGLKPGMQAFFRGINVTKTHQASGFQVAACWRGKYRGKVAKEGWFLLTNLPSLQAATRAYAKRMGIEQMLRDCKSGGYHLEGTGLKGTRLIALLLVMTLAYGAATFVGQKLCQRGVAHYIARPSQSQRVRLRHSHF